MHFAIEGTHGAGKTTAIADSRLPCDVSKIPHELVSYATLQQLSGDRRALPRINDVARSQAQRLAPGDTICDRCYSSTIVFAQQPSAGTIDDRYGDATVRWVEDALERGLLTKPDLMVVLDVEPNLAWSRVVARGPHGWTSREEVTFFARFYTNPPEWFTSLVADRYLVVPSLSREENRLLIENLVAAARASEASAH